VTAHRWDEFLSLAAVRLQRHPWITSLVGAGVLWLLWWWIAGNMRHESGPRLFALIALNAFLAHVGRGGRSTFDRLAPLLAGSILLIPISRDWADSLVSGVAGASWKKLADDPQVRREALSFAVAVGVAPVVTSWIFDLPLRRWLRADSGDGRAAVWAFAATLALAVLAWALPGDFVVPVAVALAFHAMVWSRVPARFVLLGAVVLATLAAVFVPPRIDPWATIADPDDRVARHALRSGLWIGAAALALFARRARGLTAIPAEHAVFDVAPRAAAN
jgi:hypothetical protein